MLRLALLLSTIQAQDTTTRPIPPDSYADSATARVVRAARAARDRNERLVTAYKAKVSQRLGLGLKALARDRMVYREELVANISWRRDSMSTITVVGAREGVPIATRGDQVPEDLRSDVRELVLNPGEDHLDIVGAGPGDGGFVYPLIKNGELDYKFALGDSVVTTLPGGQRVRTRALNVIPRRADVHLMSGSLWFDMDTYGLVRVAFRPAKPFNMREDLTREALKNVPGFVNVTAEVQFITMEYGFYEKRWWMPRYVAIDAEAAAGSWMKVPFRFERTYEDYEVEGGTPPDPARKFIPAGSVRHEVKRDSAARKLYADSISRAVDKCLAALGIAADSASRSVHRDEARDCRAQQLDNLSVIVPKDTMSLLLSPELGKPILDMGDLISESEIEQLKEIASHLPERPFKPRVELPRGVSALLDHARYNRIEALSLDLRGKLALGDFMLGGAARIGAADRVVNVEGTVGAVRSGVTYTLGAYRHLTTATPDVHPFGLINSFSALFFQRDEGEYFRANGADFTITNRSGSLHLRAYHERQLPVSVNTDVSLPHLIDRKNLFRPNIIADPATETGADITFRATRVFSQTLTMGTTTTIGGAGGDFGFGRGSQSVRLAVTPPGTWAGGLELAAGTSTGTVPVQSRFYLGGSSTLRGYEGGVISGPAYWLARGEIGRGIPGARLMLFTDAGWAGARKEFSRGRPLVDAGVGLSLLDGLIRLDLARALRAPKGWSFQVAVDGIL